MYIFSVALLFCLIIYLTTEVTVEQALLDCDPHEANITHHVMDGLCDALHCVGSVVASRIMQTVCCSLMYRLLLWCYSHTLFRVLEYLMYKSSACGCETH